MTYEEGLKKLAQLLEFHDVRKHTCINGFGYSQIERNIVSLFIKEHETPFDKLKKFWDEWQQPSIFISFEMFIWCHYMNGDWATFITDTEKQIHKYMNGEWDTFITDTEEQIHKYLAEYCGFVTTAEVRRLIQELKNK